MMSMRFSRKDLSVPEVGAEWVVTHPETLGVCAIAGHKNLPEIPDILILLRNDEGSEFTLSYQHDWVPSRLSPRALKRGTSPTRMHGMCEVPIVGTYWRDRVSGCAGQVYESEHDISRGAHRVVFYPRVNPDGESISSARGAKVLWVTSDWLKRFVPWSYDSWVDCDWDDVRRVPTSAHDVQADVQADVPSVPLKLHVRKATRWAIRRAAAVRGMTMKRYLLTLAAAGGAAVEPEDLMVHREVEDEDVDDAPRVANRQSASVPVSGSPMPVSSGDAASMSVTTGRVVVQRKDGRELRRKTTYLPPEIATRLDVYAARTQRDQSEITAEALAAWLGRDRPAEPR